jgi:very-short-patch-repair endonuclease
VVCRDYREMFNDKHLKIFRSKLRRVQTDAERRFWFYLRNRRFLGLKFFRQYSVGPFVLDFYCPAKRLAVELDGSQHLERADYDEARTRFLRDKGIRVERFWNHDVLVRTDVVLEKIRQLAAITPPAPS